MRLYSHPLSYCAWAASASIDCLQSTAQQVRRCSNLPKVGALCSMHVFGCRYAELNGDNRSFTSEEESLFDRSAEFAYASFRDKAAESRGMPKEELQQHAQGRSVQPQQYCCHTHDCAALVCTLCNHIQSVIMPTISVGSALSHILSSSILSPACQVVPVGGTLHSTLEAMS